MSIKATHKDQSMNIKIQSMGHSDQQGQDPEYLTVISDENEDTINSVDAPEVLPILPLRNTVLFPGVVIPISVGRDKSIQLVKKYYAGDRIIGCVSQRDPEVEEPYAWDLFEIGTVAQIMKVLEMPDGTDYGGYSGQTPF
jgi:ATP-dependent Lon protease